MNGKIAIVTGGAGVVGAGVCSALAKAGATVIALDLKTGPVAGAQRVIQCDVTSPESCAAAVQEVVTDFGGVDVLVNLAQRIVDGVNLIDTTDEQMRISFDSGPTATLRLMQLCYPYLRARGGGAIVNCGSNAGTAGSATRGAYAAAKEAIRGITKVASVEWGRDNIRVNVICPFASSGLRSDVPLEEVAVAKTPLGRMGDPETDIGSAVAYLATAPYITGRTLHIDGGYGVWR